MGNALASPEGCLLEHQQASSKLLDRKILHKFLKPSAGRERLSPTSKVSSLMRKTAKTIKLKFASISSFVPGKDAIIML